MNLPPELFAAICAAPDDDLPRLVGADWFDDNGDTDRATFIRLQCELAHLSPHSLAAIRMRLEEREWLRRYGRGWGISLGSEIVQRFVRGFVEDIQLPASQFLSLGDAIFQQTPLRGVTLTQSGGLLATLSESSMLAGLRSLQLEHAALDLQQITRLGQSPHLVGLRELRLIREGLGSAAIERLVRSPSLLGLESLDLHGNPLNDIGAHALSSSMLTNLRSLRLSQSGEVDYLYSIRSAGAASLAISLNLDRLEQLDLSGQYIGDAGLGHLARSPYLPSLRVLNVADNDIGAIGTTGIEALAGSSGFANLRVLILGGNPLGDLAARELLKWPGLPRLEYLDLNRCSIGAGVRAILDAPLAEACLIDLRGNRFRDEWRAPLLDRFGERVMLEERNLMVPLR